MTYVIGYSKFSPQTTDLNPLQYKTDVFEITSGTSISEIYAYFENPTVYVKRERSIPHVWGEESADYHQIAYDQIYHEWEQTSLPIHPIVLQWKISECDSGGNNPSPLVDITTPLRNQLLYGE